MQKQSDLVYFFALIFSGFCVGVILRYGNIWDLVLLGILIVSIFFTCINFGKPPKWIISPLVQMADIDELKFKNEAWKLWKKNVKSERYRAGYVALSYVRATIFRK